MTQEELNKIIENHQHWLNEDCEDWEDMRADLRCCNLGGCDLSNSDLRCCNLSNSNLRGCDLSNSNLGDCDLSNSDLSNSDLRCCNLGGCDLSSCNLSNVKHNEYTVFYDLQCPEEGDFIAFKKASNKIVKLRIPTEARRSSATTRRCRAEFADVLEILNADKTQADVSEVHSNYDYDVLYKVGERVMADMWDDNRWNECSHGIHFFLTFDEAVNY